MKSSDQGIETAELVKRVALGDEQAYRIIYDRYKTSIYSTILNLGDDEFLAEEVLQESFIRLWNYRDKLHDVEKFDAWIYRVAKNVFLTKIKSQSIPTEPLDLILHDIYHAPMSHDSTDFKELESVFEKAISHLSPKQRMTYQMIKLEGLSRKEVAQILNVSPETVKWNLDESVKKVRSYMLQALDKLPLVTVLYFFVKEVANRRYGLKKGPYGITYDAKVFLMNKATANKIYIGRTMGVFVGQFNDNALHKHYALQISVTAFGEFQITDENNQHLFYSTCFISSNIKHRFSSDETTLIILINPISTLGHQLAARYRDKKIVNLDHELKPLVDFLIAYLNDGNKFDILIDNLTTFLTRFKCACENHFEDDRIYSAITYLENNFDRIVSLKEIAAQSFLSETRFLHLFKEKTNLNFRRYQLWNKLVKSLPALEAHSITETAHRFGFTDSSHYSRTFKETFGLSPKFLLSLK